MSRFAADLPVDVVRLRHRAAGMRRYGFGYLLHRYARNRLALVGLWVVLGIMAVALFASWVAPASPIKPDFGNLLRSPSAPHPMGTDDLGRDVLSRVIYGARTALLAGVISVGIAVIAGLPVGLLSGYYGGRVDDALVPPTGALVSVSFLGLGTQPPTPSWGSMLNIAQAYLSTAPWMAVWPGLAIFITVLALNLLGDGLREALDPRLR